MDVQKHWYALQVTTGHEKQAQKELLENIEGSGDELKSCFGEVLIPMEKRVKFKRNVKTEIEEQIFPGYMFVEIAEMEEKEGMDDMQKETLRERKSKCWHLVRKTRWINAFIGGSADAPRPLSEEEITSIQNRIGAGADGARALYARFVIGEQVRIKDGPFDDFSGTIEAINNERERLTIAVMVFGRSTPVELDFNQVEKQ